MILVHFMEETQMTDSEKTLAQPPEGYFAIENDINFQDVFAEIAGVTEYSVDGVHYVNLSFLSQRVVPYADEKGRPAMSKIEFKRVGSVTLTHDKAVALRDSLIENLGDTPKGAEKKS